MRPSGVLVAAVLAAFATVPAWSPRAQDPGVTPLGEDFQVNTTTTFIQRETAVAIDADGDFVVVWESEYSAGDDTDNSSIQGQRFSSDGTPTGDEIQVNSYTTGRQHAADVAAGPDGDFVVVWLGDSSEFSNVVKGQRYASDGAPIGGELELSRAQSEYPSVAMQPGGEFIVVWKEIGDETMLGQRFGSDGMPLGSGFIANSSTSNGLRFPEVAADDIGDFVVVWQDYREEADRYDIRARRFASTGAPIGGDFRVNDDPAGEQYRPAVATASGTGFTVVWEHSDGGSYIRGRRYDSAGSPVGTDIDIDQVDLVGLTTARVALDDNGNSLVLWDEGFLDGDDLYGRLYDASGDALGDQFLINSLTTDDQNDADVALAPDGQMIAVWNGEASTGTDTDFFTIQGRRLVLPLFADGFESGDTSRWTLTVP